MDERLAQLAQLHGLALVYQDFFGNECRAGEASLIGVLAAMGIAADSPAAIDAALAAAQHPGPRSLLPPVCVVVEDALQWSLQLTLPVELSRASLSWQVDTEYGELRQAEFDAAELERPNVPQDDALAVCDLTVILAAALPTGYHQFSIWRGDAQIAACPLIVVPRRCYRPSSITDGRRVWGLTAQLYALRSERNWGIGDFFDLRSLVETAAARGAAIVMVNPLHALFPHDPAHVAPYSSSSRLFLNTLYLDISAVAEAHEDGSTQQLVRSASFQQRLHGLRTSETVDYEGVAAAKREVLERLFEYFRRAHLSSNTLRAQAFRRWCAAAGEELRTHALFEALQEHLFRSDEMVSGWPAWPQAYRRPDAPEVAAFARDHGDRLEFYCYLQWLADEQLAAVGRRSYELGLGVGLCADLAVSINRGGAEAWANQDLYARDATIGAPPDAFDVNGQDWRLLPILPRRLRDKAYAPWIATLRANMHHAGAVRIDHVLALLRLYWVPRGADAVGGVYVHYPFEEMLGIVALESQRNHCLVIGDDLGTVPDELRQRLTAADVLSTRVLYLERDANGNFLASQHYPRSALVAASTHDLPTLVGWWSGRDLQLRESFGLFPSPALRDQQLLQRAQDRARLLLALEREGLLPEGVTPDPQSAPELTPALCLAIHHLLARSPAQIVVAQLEDILGVQDQANLPGTTNQYPNWRRKLPRLEGLLGDDERLATLARMFAQERPAPVVDAARTGSTVIPRATYRVQLHREFGFAAARAVVPYLAALGVSHLYCSPFLRARPGSKHGYDVIDHNVLNPEIGDRNEFEQLVATLRAHGMGLLMDVVPNHMDVLGPDNAWWMDVLENGQASRFADYFDIDWQATDPELAGRVLVPILGDHYGIVLERGELKLTYEPDTGRFVLRYYEHSLPLDPATYPAVLERVLNAPGADAITAAVHDAVASLAASLRHLPDRHSIDPAARAERSRDKEVHKATLARLVHEHAALGDAIETILALLNGNTQERSTLDDLDALINAQAYRLAYWRVAGDEINYRRFFDINQLAALRMENQDVFENTHRLIFELLATGKADGLRVDHPDGLLDPATYFARLQQRYLEQARPGAATTGERPLYVVAEKIVAPHEQLPAGWRVHGTTGYRFANVVTGLFVDPSAKARLDRAWRAFVGNEAIDFEVLAYRCRRLVMATSLAGQLTVLAGALLRLARGDRRTRDFTLNLLRQALAEVVACFPVYRTYIVDRPSAHDLRWIDWAVARARRTSRAADPSVLDFVHAALCGRAPPGAPEQLREGYRAFARRLQQFTAPVMAKGVEDTAFYRHHRLVALNEVGGDPDVFGISVSAFHGASRDRAQHWPHTMLSTTTHDTKRSEDVRARLVVISELPAMWRLAVRRWSRMNRSHRHTVEERPAPSRNDEYLLYQTLVGTLPHDALDEETLAAYRDRIVAYMLKAVREAKVHSSWISQNVEYEQALVAFTSEVLGRTSGNLFLDNLREAASTFAWYGALNSLATTLLKFASPGVPDLYQGQETADLSLVDPDNRRPVDFAQRQRDLEAMQEIADHDDPAPSVAQLCESPADGRAKTWITWRALQLRRAFPDLFADGDYLGLNVSGPRARHVVAFARRKDEHVLVAATGRLFGPLGVGRDTLPVGDVWKDTAIALPAWGRDLTLRDALTGRWFEANGQAFQVDQLFAVLPFVLLHGQVEPALFKRG